ncbi:tRNA glutamyl-Q(34) synthetase GluQRS [Gordonia sp. HY002]|uniref:tRNA glutamyl-Q(34) synthetase GluQRS n=1 Tax=Gordonia zhenghanii TaxID=2911516 RepID=UPI001EF0E683|nr:tRNA glutamyl-Q(34) synthetase GluQRS [Gordonia zhenghanii]MCF8571878.1 tRNA glutamyl-Q(34) synthetase GluQRS [Gordonia zhenghanii]MCF8604409.1 tRNA glutamyl-Q(34) synthetase GluQRS [Gordonia zhenghanii]
MANDFAPASRFAPAGRFAPSPSGDLHIGNLRTAVLAFLFARSSDRRFLMRVEDLDRVRPGAQERQLADLASIGLTWDGPVLQQSDRYDAYSSVIGGLVAEGDTFECFCTRREILDAPTAPHAPQGSYPGTCRDLTDAERDERRRTRPAAIRLRSEVTSFTVTDILHREFTGDVDDFVLQRNDGTPAYNLAVVVDDAASGVDQVVRGDDLLTSAPRQAYLATRLGYSPPEYAHVPMVLNADHKRLAKRDGAVTVADLAEQGVDAESVLSMIAASLGLADDGEKVTMNDLGERFSPSALPRDPWIFDAG